MHYSPAAADKLFFHNIIHHTFIKKIIHIYIVALLLQSSAICYVNMVQLFYSNVFNISTYIVDTKICILYLFKIVIFPCDFM